MPYYTTDRLFTLIVMLTMFLIIASIAKVMHSHNER